jgi:hypothetical protein
MTDVIRNGKLEVIGYREILEAQEILRGRHGRKLGVYDRDTKVTRDRDGRIVGLNLNQLLWLL